MKEIEKIANECVEDSYKAGFKRGREIVAVTFVIYLLMFAILMWFLPGYLNACIYWIVGLLFEIGSSVRRDRVVKIRRGKG